MVRPLRGGGVRARPLRRKELSLILIFLFVAVDKLNKFCLRRNMQILILVYKCIVFSCRKENSTVFTGFLKYLPKKMALSAQKLWKFFFCKNPFPAIFRRKKKVPNCH